MCPIENSIPRKIISDTYTYYKNRGNASKLGFDMNNAFTLIKIVTKILDEEKAVLDIMTDQEKSDFVIVGDIHGSLESLFNIFESKGYPDKTKYLFLGDYVDRGRNSCEVMMTLYAYKCLYPNQIYLIRGNHEFRDMNENYGFKSECLRRISQQQNEKFYKEITGTFKYLPICSILNDKIFCVHGGISALLENRDQLKELKKVNDYFCSEDSVQAEFLWSDPDDSVSAYTQSDRGIGCLFGRDALDYFLKSMDFEFVIRGHQKEDSGYNWPFNENEGILTIFSAKDYCGSFNDGAIAYYPKNDNQKTQIIPEIQVLKIEEENEKVDIIEKVYKSEYNAPNDIFQNIENLIPPNYDLYNELGDSFSLLLF